MISDYHMHTSFSGDSTADPHDMADRAISLGMKSICITDHMDTDSEEPEFILDTDRYLLTWKGCAKSMRADWTSASAWKSECRPPWPGATASM